MPGTDDVVALETPCSERAARVVADAGDGVETSVTNAEAEGRALDLDLGHLRPAQLLDAPDLTPVALDHRASAWERDSEDSGDYSSFSLDRDAPAS